MGQKLSTTRRRFLQTASGGAAALAIPYFVPATSLGFGLRPAPSERIVMGAIGCGGKGRHNTSMFLNQPDVQFVAVADVDSRHAAADKQQIDSHYQNSDCAVFRDFRGLVARPDIDAVHVSTPDHWHALTSIAAMRQGKDVYCEKPLTNSVTEAIAVRDTSRKLQRIVQTGSHERANDDVRRGCELVRNGLLGKIDCVEINMPFIDEWHHKIVLEWRGTPEPQPVPDELDWNVWLGPAAEVPYHERRSHFWWRFILAHGGGEMTDRGAHIIDIAQLALGRDDSGPVRIKASGKRIEDSLYDAFVDYQFENEYADGIRMIGINQNPRGLKIIGSDGWLFIHVHGGQLEADRPELLQTTLGEDAIQLGRSPGHHRDFIDCVQSRRQPLADAEVGCRTATICHLNNIAMLTDSEIRWDPVSETVQGNDEAAHLLKPQFREPWEL
ncbi:MAG TPA: Gfo/Idh/MocA family oxidoreductase [Pirellulaceae bacterium]|nr:Gfo/Idh/MocA family oxidoreductase [Pirellulaceae bacterium]